MAEGIDPLRAFRRSRAERGFYLIGLLIVLIIIAVVLGKGYFRQDPTTGATQAQMYIERSKDTACTADRLAMQADITQIGLLSGGGPPSIQALRARLGPRRCQAGGEFLLDAKGNVYCTVHAPPPEGLEVFKLIE